jgi:hypothetical protein
MVLLLTILRLVKDRYVMKSNKLICLLCALISFNCKFLSAAATCTTKVQIINQDQDGDKLSLVFWDLPEKKWVYAFLTTSSSKQKIALTRNLTNDSYEVERSTGNLFLVVSNKHITDFEGFSIEESATKNAIFNTGSLPRRLIPSFDLENMPSDTFACALKLNEKKSN